MSASVTHLKYEYKKKKRTTEIRTKLKGGNYLETEIVGFVDCRVREKPKKYVDVGNYLKKEIVGFVDCRILVFDEC